jgi:transcriptional regulator with XRE-family HTH domain
MKDPRLLDHLAEARSAYLKQYRRRLGISQAGLAEFWGVSLPTLSRWEQGDSGGHPLMMISLLEEAMFPKGVHLDAVCEIIEQSRASRGKRR